MLLKYIRQVTNTDLREVKNISGRTSRLGSEGHTGVNQVNEGKNSVINHLILPSHFLVLLKLLFPLF